MVDFNKNRCLNSIGAIHFAAPTTIRNSFDEFLFFLAKRTKTKEILFLLFSHLSEQIARLLCYVLGRALFTKLYHDPVSMEKNRWCLANGEKNSLLSCSQTRLSCGIETFLLQKRMIKFFFGSFCAHFSDSSSYFSYCKYFASYIVTFDSL